MFETHIYQPFFNILVGLYWGLGQISPSLLDMGIAVIIFSLLIRVLLFPLTIAGERSEEEKRRIAEQVNAAKALFPNDTIKRREEVRKVMKANTRVVIATTANIIIQIIIIIMLYRIFTTGLEGRDFHLLYDFMPRVDHVNLMFLGKYDLSHTNATLNFIQSVMIFVVELLVALRSPLPVGRKEVVMMQFFLPVGSYLVFMLMPAGKKVFIITSLAFSTLYNALRLLQDMVRRVGERFTKPPIPASDAVTTPSEIAHPDHPASPTH